MLCPSRLAVAIVSGTAIARAVAAVAAASLWIVALEHDRCAAGFGFLVALRSLENLGALARPACACRRLRLALAAQPAL